MSLLHGLGRRMVLATSSVPRVHGISASMAPALLSAFVPLPRQGCYDGDFRPIIPS